MRQRPRDLYALARRQQPLAAQHRAQLFDALGRPMRQIRQGAVLGLAIVAVALAKQNGGW
jgi:hypothetical protein